MNENGVDFEGAQYGAFERMFNALTPHYPTIYQFRDAMIDAGCDAALMNAMTNEWIARNVGEEFTNDHR